MQNNQIPDSIHGGCGTIRAYGRGMVERKDNHKTFEGDTENARTNETEKEKTGETNGVNPTSRIWNENTII